ncbi:MAG: hypothetical protein WBB24_08205 [Maribacter sp.]
MKIGVVIDEFKKLANWQLRILEKLTQDLDFNVALLIPNDDSEKLHSTTLFSSCTFFEPKTIGLSGYLLKGQFLFEKKKLFKEKRTVSTSELNSTFNTNEILNIELKKQGIAWDCSDENVLQIRNIGLDLLLNLSSHVLSGKIIDSASQGTWAILHKEHTLKNSNPVGFTETLQKKPGIGSAILKLSIDPKKNWVLDTAFFNRHWSMVETGLIAQEGTVSLLFKNLKKLKNEKIDISGKLIYPIEECQVPTIWLTVNYLFNFYGEVLNKFREKFMSVVFRTRHECWTIFTGDKGFFETITQSNTALEMPETEFWADPFLFEHHGDTYVFFESYSYQTKRGKISCGILKNNQLVEVWDVLDKDYHLSFPFIFKEDGEIFLMPETGANKRLEIYKAKNFPLEWELCVTAFEGEMVADAFFYTDEAEQKWLFMNKQMDIASPLNTELFIYKVDSIRLKHIEPHLENPVLIDARVARNGGSIFKHEGNVYRPSQRNIDGIYGRALNINKIEKLTIEEYQERTVQVIQPDFDSKLMGLHHIHELNGKFVFDAAFKSR